MCVCVVGLGLYGVSALGVRDVSVCVCLRAGACESVRGCGCLLTHICSTFCFQTFVRVRVWVCYYTVVCVWGLRYVLS